jgi:hypothetical protein
MRTGNTTKTDKTQTGATRHHAPCTLGVTKTLKASDFEPCTTTGRAEDLLSMLQDAAQTGKHDRTAHYCTAQPTNMVLV